MHIPPRETYAEIDLEALRWNFTQIQNYVNPVPVCAVVKANAYGHGAGKIAEELVKAGASYLAVAIIKEGVELRELGIEIPILVLIPAAAGEIEAAVIHNLELTVSSVEHVQLIAEASKKLNTKAIVHIFMDTGMQRGGLLWDREFEGIEKIVGNESVQVKGIYTHFAAADRSDLTFTYTQLERFNTVLSRLSRNIPLVHTASSAAIMQVKESFFTMVRPGLALYGYYYLPECKQTIPLKPVMSIKSYIADVRTYCAPEGIGYSLTYKIQSPTRIASVPIGYCDGINRLLSNNGSVLIGGNRYPIAGRVAMDWISVDTGTVNTVKCGDEVVLLGRQGDNEISIYEWCKKLNTIPNDIISNINSRLQRKYVNGLDGLTN